MHKHRYLYILFLIAVFALSLIIVDKALSCVPALCGQVEATSFSTVTETGMPGGLPPDGQARTKTADNSSAEYGVLEQYDWMLVCGGLLLATAIAVLATWRYAVICRTKAIACRAELDTKEQARAKLLAQANELLSQCIEHTSDAQLKAAAGVCSGSSLRHVLDRNPSTPEREKLLFLLRQTELFEKQLIRAQKRCNAMIGEYNAAIYSFPVCLFRRLFHDNSETAYVPERDFCDMITDTMLEL